MDKERELCNVERNQRQVAREQLVTAMSEGQSWQQVSAGSPVTLKRAMAYRLLRAVRTKGNIALQDGRHGHPSKFRGEIRTFLEASCRETPSTPSSDIQTQLQERFDVRVSISQINRVRAALGVSNRSNRQKQEKKQEEKEVLPLSQSGKKVLDI
jgi:transposase